jgi:hypothetical protein
MTRDARNSTVESHDEGSTSTLGAHNDRTASETLLAAATIVGYHGLRFGEHRVTVHRPRKSGRGRIAQKLKTSVHLYCFPKGHTSEPRRGT